MKTMKHDLFARWLKVLVVGTTLFGLASTFTIVPFFGEILRIQYPDCRHLVLPWEITICLCAIPCFAAMLLSWRIADHIQKGNYFCFENGRLFLYYSRLALGDSIFFLITSIFFYVKGMNHLGYLFMILLVTFIGLAVFICTAALSYFVNSAARLQEDNDLTI